MRFLPAARRLRAPLRASAGRPGRGRPRRRAGAAPSRSCGRRRPSGSPRGPRRSRPPASDPRARGGTASGICARSACSPARRSHGRSARPRRRPAAAPHSGSPSPGRVELLSRNRRRRPSRSRSPAAARRSPYAAASAPRAPRSLSRSRRRPLSASACRTQSGAPPCGRPGHGQRARSDASTRTPAAPPARAAHRGTSSVSPSQEHLLPPGQSLASERQGVLLGVRLPGVGEPRYRAATAVSRFVGEPIRQDGASNPHSCSQIASGRPKPVSQTREERRSRSDT